MSCPLSHPVPRSGPWLALALLALLWAGGLRPKAASAQGFTEQAAARGLALDGIKDGGFAFEDLNGDGWLDLVVNTDQDDAAHRTRMYRNDGPPAWTFTDITDTHCRGCNRSVSPDAAPERSVVFADVNHDGWPDFARNSARRLEIFLNKGPAPVDGDVPFSFGDAAQGPNLELYTWNVNLDNPAQGIPFGMNTEGLGWLDYDQDGDLDLFIENHDWGMEIYENAGYASGTFFHATPNGASRGLPISATTGDYAAVGDFDDDGRVDAIARKQDQRDFFRNVGGAFAPVLSFDQQANNDNKGGAGLYDFDNDGDLDLVWTEHDANQIWWQAGTGSGVFAPSGEPWASAGIPDPFDGVNHAIDGLAVADVDLDGDLDLFLADDTAASYLFLNQLTETGVPGFVRSNLGIDVQGDAEGATFVDIDNDGDPDLYLNLANGPNQLWINDLDATPAGENGLTVRVLDNREASGLPGAWERDALGATLRLYACDGTPRSGLREVNGGYGHGTQDTRRVPFGLPLGPDLEYLLEVRYPERDGTRTIVRRRVVPSDLAPGSWLAVRPQDAPETCNLPPVAVDDAASGCAGDTLTVFPLANDGDPDGSLDPGSFAILAGPFAGTAAWDPAGATLTWSGSGPDSLRYRICDNASPAACAEAWIRLDVGGGIADNALTQDPFCPGLDDGAIATGPGGGVPPYAFAWSTGDTTAGLVGLTAGTYGLTVTDALGCAATFSYTLVDPAPLVLAVDTVAASALGACDGQASVSVSGGTPPYTLAWSPGGATDSVLTGLCPGAYTAVVMDANGCTATAVAIISAPACGLAVSATGQDAPCAGEPGGSAVALPSGGSPPYAFLWLPSGDTTATAEGLGAGTYTVLVTDAAGCAASDTAVVGEPPALAASLSVTDVSVSGAADGSATATVSGGTPPYAIAWSNGDTGPLADSLAPGPYTVALTDANGCALTLSFAVLDAGCALTLSVSGTPPACAGEASGNAAVTPTGGTPPYAIAWSTGDTTALVTGLSGGSFTVSVTDASGCLAMGTVTLTPPPALGAAVSVAGPACAGGDGSAAVTPSGGTPPYTLAWSDGGAGAVRDPLAPGAYTVTITDAAGCDTTLALTVPDGAALDVGGTLVAGESCAGAEDGSIFLLPSGGTPPYTLFWPHNGSTLSAQTGLAPGTYAVFVTDAGGCTDSFALDVPAAAALALSGTVTHPACVGDSTAAVDLSVAGGTPPYAYFWSNGAVVEDPSGLAAGTYTVWVSDANGCTAAAAFSAVPASALDLGLLAVTPACGASDGRLTAVVSGATGPVSVSWSTGASGTVLDGIGPGTYTATATDGTCSVSATVVLGSTDGPALATGSIPSSCAGADGSAWATATGAGPFTWSWPDGQTTDTATGLAPGTYTVLVTDTAGCASTATVTVGGTGGPVLATAVIPPSACGAADGLANATASGGTPPYAYAWSNGDTGPTATGLAPGIWTVTVSDAAGCTASAAVTVADGFGLGLTPAVTDASCGAVDGTAGVTPSAGTAPYAYAWSTGDSTASLGGLAPGSYTVLVTDAAGCSDVATLTVGGSTGFGAVVTVSDAGCAGDDGAASVSLFGGLPPYDVLWSTGAAGPSVDGLPPGSYAVTVTDAAGCARADSFTVALDCPGPPTALRDTVATHEGVFLVIPVTINDADPAGTPPFPTLVDAPTHGSAAVLPDGTVGYAPDPGFIGADSLRYEICNADGCAQAWVLIYVGIGDNPPLALPDAGTALPGETLLVDIGANDADPDGQPLIWILTEAPSAGTALVGAGRALWSPPPGFAGTASFLYAACDPGGLCDTARVTVTVDGPGAGDPVAIDDASSTTGDPVTRDVLANDAGGAFPLDPATLVVDAGPANGTVAVGPAPGVLTYTPDAGFTGEDLVAYSVCNTAGFCASAVWRLRVGAIDAPPVTGDDLATTPRNVPVRIDVGANDTDPDGDAGPPEIVLPPAQGTALVLPDGAVAYTPGAGYVGTDAFTYRVCDARGACDDAVVIVTITPANDPPLAKDDYSHTTAGVPVTITPTDNDLDPDGDPLGVSVLAGPTFGAVSLGAGGTITYVPGADGVTDALTLEICDPAGACATSTWTVTVGATDNPPVVRDDWTTTLACTLVVVEILANDVDPDTGPVGPWDPGALSPTITVPPVPGEALITDDRKLVYFPPDGFTGTVTVGYEACDTSGACATATVTLHVLPAVLPPAAFDDAYTVAAGGVLGAEPLANDVDPNGHALVDPAIVTPPANGTATLNADGSLTWTPAPGFLGLDSLAYAICDTVSDCLGPGGCDTAWVFLTVFDPDPDPVDSNRAPVAVDDSACTRIGEPVELAVLANDADPDGDALIVTGVWAPSAGTATFSADGRITYTPGPGFGPAGDVFSYSVCDPDGACDTALVWICLDRGFFLPDVITPNGDGVNDLLVIDGLEAFTNPALVVYNRWGDEVYSARPYRNDWDGTYRDRGQLPDGTYYLILTPGDGSAPLAGYLAIFR